MARGLSADSLHLQRYDTTHDRSSPTSYGQRGVSGPGQDAPGSIRVAPVAADHSNRFGDQTPVSSDVGDTEVHMKCASTGSTRYTRLVLGLRPDLCGRVQGDPRVADP